MDYLSERAPPEQYIKFEAGNGEKRLALVWEPRTGFLQVSRIGAGSAFAVSKKFKAFEKQTVSDVIQMAHDWMSSIFDDQGIVDAATKILSGIVSGMKSIFPDGQEEERER